MILVTCDTLRPDHLGCYGYPLDTSPNVDALAAESVLFLDAWSTTSLTGPAMSSMLSGLLPDEIGVSAGNNMQMPSPVETFPEILGRERIPTAAVVSNWVLQRAPAELGDVGVAQGFAFYDDQFTGQELNRPLYERNGPATTAAAIAWLESQPEFAERPFFLWVHYQDPHGPYVPPGDLVDRFLEPGRDHEPPLRASESDHGVGAIPAYQVLPSERRPSRYRARYDGEIRAFDEAFGGFLAWLAERDLLEDALVIFTADHGESLGEHDTWFCHGANLHAEETRVPLLVRFPKGERKGERRKEIASLLDVFPTVLDAFGIALPPRSFLGASLWNPDLPAGRIVPQSLAPFNAAQRVSAVTTERFRLVFDRKAGFRLYDLVADPGELSDHTTANREVAASLIDRARILLNPGRATHTGLERTDEAMRKGLRALGYTGGSEGH